MAYAAVVSLVKILKQLLPPDEFPLNFPKPKDIQFLYDNAFSLQSSLEKMNFVPKDSRDTVKELENQIREAIYKAQDAIESFLSSQILPSEPQEIPAGDHQSTSTSLSLEEIIANIGPIAKRAEEIADSIRQQTGDSLAEDTRSTKTTFSSKIKIVGQEKDKKRVTDQVIADISQLQILPIIGMPGIGKTTLARSIYEDPEMENQFHIRGWVTVSPDYNVRDIFIKLLASLVSKGQKSDDSGSMKNLGDIVNQERADLSLNLHQRLYNTKYLIVVDDMWDKRIWDEVKKFFPDNKNGSRVLLTTRIREIANYAAETSEFHHEMQPLDQENSWTLLCEKAFDGGDCPPHLKDIGWDIAKNCQGLPLSITVVGGLLSQKKTLDYWKVVAEDINTAAENSKEAYLEILSLSYNHLPGRLKGCFLYMGAFPEDSQILVSKLIKLWVAEGFLAPQSPFQSLEQVAKQNLVDLVSRNLIMVRRTSSDGQIKTCGVHDILRDIAVKVSGKEKFFHAVNRYRPKLPEGADTQRRLSVHKNIFLCIEKVFNSTKSITHARTLLCPGQHHHHPIPFSLTFELLRVLDALTVYFIEFPNEILRLIHLRYLSFTYNGKLPSSLSNLRNLEILILRQHPKIIFVGTSILPVEIWDMPKLRHLLFTESELPPLIPSDHPQNCVFLGNLQSLSNVNAACCTEEVLQEFPNLKKLGLWIEAPGEVNFYLDLLQELEVFKLTVLNPDPESEITFLPKFDFPRTLKKLSLSGCGIPWEGIKVIAELPHLQVLKLRELAFQGEEWRLDEMVFPELKYLLLEYMDLVYWGDEDAEEACHFPNLKLLFVRHCYKLEEIPSDIGNIGGLELIELVDCSPSAVKSAEKIRNQQKYMKNDFQVRIYSSWE